MAKWLEVLCIFIVVISFILLLGMGGYALGLAFG